MINVSDEDEIMMMTANGMVIRTPVKTIRPIGRNCEGVRLIRLKEGDKLVSVAPVVSEENGETEGAETEGAETDEAESQQPEQTE